MTNNQNNAPINLAEVPTFTKHFHKYIEPYLIEIEAQRQRALKIYSLIVAIGVILSIASKVLAHGSLEDAIPAIIVLTFLLSHICKKDFSKKIKRKIFNNLFSYLGSFKLEEKNYHNAYYFKNIKMINDFNDSPRIDDYITGQYKGLNIEIEEVGLTKTTGSGKNRSTTTTFSGLILSLPQVKKAKTLLIIRNKAYTLTRNQGKEVLLEDPEFNKTYQTSSNDQIEARYILTPTFMEYLKKLNQKGIIITCCFQDDKIYIAIKTKKDMFEPPFFKSALNINTYREIIEQLGGVLKIIDILKLDQNIGL